MRSDAVSARKIYALLFALTLAGAALRFAGLGRMLPELREPDAFIVYELQSIHGDPALVPSMNFHDRYPLLVARALALLPYPAVPARIAGGPEVPARIAGGGAERVHLAACARPFLVVRTAVAALACFLAPLTFLLARKLRLPLGASLAAAFFVATSLLHILYSGEARPHAAHATLALVAVLAAIWAGERASFVRAAIAAVAAVAAIGSLQTGLFVLPPLMLALAFASRDLARNGASRARMFAARASVVAVPLAALAAGVFLFYPTLPYIDANGIHTASAAGGGHSIPFEYLNALGLARAPLQLWMHDPIFAILTACGIIVAIDAVARRRREPTNVVVSGDPARRTLWISAAHAVPYLAFLSLNGEVYDRFLMPLLPYCACLAGAAALWIVQRVRSALASESARRVATAAIVVASTAWPALAAIQFARVARAESTLEQTARYLKQSARPDTELVLTSPSIALPLLYTPGSVHANLQDPAGKVTPWIVYQSLIPAGTDAAPRYRVEQFPAKLAAKPHEGEIELVRAYLDEHRPTWVVLEISKKMMGLSMMRSLLRVACERGEIAFKSRGSAPAALSMGSVDYQDVEDLALRIVETEAFGPPIVVFRMR